MAGHLGLERAVMVGGLVQELRERCDVRLTHLPGRRSVIC
jgi:hypothetical protein